ncbi:hypothetical protein AB9M75_11895 [Lactobacillus sp. AN1001]
MAIPPHTKVGGFPPIFIESALASIIVYIGLFFGAMRGVTIVERWLGVSVGQNDMAQQVMGTMIATNALTQTTAAAGNLVAGVAGAGYSMAKTAPDVAKNVSGGLTKAAGAVSGVGDQIAQQGLGGTVKGGLYNADDAISKKMQDGVNGLKDKYQEGHNSASEALKNNYPTPEDKLNHPNAYDESVISDSVPDNDSNDPTPDTKPNNISNDVPNDVQIEGEEYDDHDDIPPTATNGEVTPENADMATGGISEEDPTNTDGEEQIDGVPNVDGGLSEENPDKPQDPSEVSPENGQNIKGGLKPEQANVNTDKNDIPQENQAGKAVPNGGLKNKAIKEAPRSENIAPENVATETMVGNDPYGGIQDDSGEISSEQKNNELNEFLNANSGETNVPQTAAGPAMDQTTVSKGVSDNASSPTVSTVTPSTAPQKVNVQTNNDPQNVSMQTDGDTANVSVQTDSNTAVPVQNVNNKPTHFQRARAQHQQASQSLSQGMQYMTSGRSHIHGKRDDDDE